MQESEKYNRRIARRIASRSKDEARRDAMTRSLPLVVVLLFARAGSAQDHQHAAPAAEKLGTVHFTTTCSAPAQTSFDRAVALLHSFEFGRAIAVFEATLKTDPSCTISYWGIALSRWGNPFAAGAKPAAMQQQGRDAIEHAKAAPPKSEREAGYVDAAAKLYADFEHT